jgi:hypothetical protein
MPVAPLFNAPSTEPDLLRFAFYNWDHHTQVSNYILTAKNITIARQEIYPMPSPTDQEAFGAWLLDHQSWHTQINGVLGTRANNLLAVDFSNYDALAAWAFLHATEHQTWQTMTGVA